MEKVDRTWARAISLNLTRQAIPFLAVQLWSDDDLEWKKFRKPHGLAFSPGCQQDIFRKGHRLDCRFQWAPWRFALHIGSQSPLLITLAMELIQVLVCPIDSSKTVALTWSWRCGLASCWGTYFNGLEETNRSALGWSTIVRGVTPNSFASLRVVWHGASATSSCRRSSSRPDPRPEQGQSLKSSSVVWKQANQAWAGHSGKHFRQTHYWCGRPIQLILVHLWSPRAWGS